MTNAPRLRAPRQWLDPRVTTWWRVLVALPVAAMSALLLLLGLVIEAARWWLVAPGLAVAAVGGIAAVVLPRWWYRLHRWEVTDTAVFTRTGWFWQTWRVAPMSRIQTVDTTRGPLQRMFGLATVTVTTASSAGPVVIAGLADEQARGLAEELTRITDETPGDAT